MANLFSEVLGREVKVPDHPQRIISFSPAATEALFQIGLGGSLVGVSAFCARPAEARTKRRVGSYNTASTELLDEIAPDLIFAVTGYQRDFALNLSRRYAVYPLELPVSVAGIVDFVLKVGLVAGEPEAARELAGSLLRSLSTVGRARKLSTYVEIDLGGPVTFGAHSYITDAIRLVGCSSLYEGQRLEWLKPDLEAVAESDPDVIIYEPKMFSKFGESDLDDLIRTRGWDRLRAVKAKNCLLTPGPLDFLAHHGPSFITQTVPWLEKSLRNAADRIGT